MPSERSLNKHAVAIFAACLCLTGAWAQEPQPLALDDALACALNHNPRITSAVARVEKAKGGVALARSGAQPAVTLRASGRLQVPVPEITITLPGSPGSPPPAPTSFKVGRPDQASLALGVVWPLWTGGRVGAAVGAARAQVAAAEADLQQATEQLLYETGAAYYETLRARSAQTAAEAALRRAEEDLRTVQAARAAGLVTGAAVSAADAARRQAEQAVVVAKTTVTDAEQSLNALLGRALNAPVRLVEQPVTVEPPQASDQVLLVALVTRPELLALDSRRDAAQQAIAQAKAERMPTVGFAAQAGLQTETPFTPPHQESIGLEFSWPVLTYGPSRAHEQTARATVREIEATRAELESGIAYQVETTGRRVADALARLAAAQDAAKAAEAAAREARALHAGGAATQQQLIAAETALDEATARRAQAEAGLSIARLSQARALGLMRALFLAPPKKAGDQ